MNKGILKSTFREIKSSFGRYMAILLIVALGVGFFAGLKSAYDAMVYSADIYWDELHMFDYHLLSTLGFDENAAASLAKEDGVLAVEEGKSADVIISAADGKEYIVKTIALPEKVNRPELVTGRMPENSNECLADNHAYREEDIGKKIKISSSNEEEDSDKFKVKEYTIVGIVRSPLYTLYDRGSTSLGDGKLDSFFYIMPEAYDMDYDTELYVLLDKNADIYSAEYEDLVEKKQEIWDKLCEQTADDRYDRIYVEAMDEITDAEDELKDKKSEGEEELSDALTELTDGKNKLADGRSKIKNAKKELEDNEKKFAKEEKKYKDGLKAYEKNKKEFDKGKKAYDKAVKEFNTQYAAYEQGVTAYEEGKAAYDASETEYAAAFSAFEAGKAYLSEEERVKTEGELAFWRQQLDETKATLDATKMQLDAAGAALTEGKKTLDAEGKKISSGEKELEKAKKQLDKAGKQIEDAKKQFSSGKKEIEKNEKDINKASSELIDGQAEYDDAKKEFDDKIADAEEEIKDAKEEIEDLEKPETYVLDRKTNTGYASFENDSKIIMGVARVFPIFFFLVAALVCMTTMTRMIEEQRTQIGVLKALGYSNSAIIGKYLIYSGSAAIIGSIIGYFVGSYVFTHVIWIAYKMLYNFGELHVKLNAAMAIILLLVALLCSAGTTFFVCYKELQEMAASLMRPKAPKAGKRVLLERINFIWKRLKFLDKVSVRNLFRYKRRFFMMIIGVSGCTALVVTGMGIKDSIADIAETQFTKISLYDMSAVVKHEKKVEVDGIKESILVSSESVDMTIGSETKEVTLFVPENEKELSSYMDLHTKKGKNVDFPGDGTVAITEKLAEIYHIEIGDKVVFRNEDGKQGNATVSGIYLTFFDQNIILSKNTYQQLFGKNAEYNEMLVKVSEGTDVNKVSAELIKNSDVSVVSQSSEIRDMISDMMRSLNYVVALVIACAAMLAFVVIYNLNNINITERVREIATIKVLGFYKEETSSYVFRENFVLTLIASIVGIFLGYFLHAFVMSQIKIDLIAFDVKIKPISYVVGVVLTILFNQIVNWFMARKLDNIDMAESLKSVE